MFGLDRLQEEKLPARPLLHERPTLATVTLDMTFQELQLDIYHT
jgi:hypothetical protein